MKVAFTAESLKYIIIALAFLPAAWVVGQKCSTAPITNNCDEHAVRGGCITPSPKDPVDFPVSACIDGRMYVEIFTAPYSIQVYTPCRKTVQYDVNCNLVSEQHSPGDTPQVVYCGTTTVASGRTVVQRSCTQ